MQRESYASTKKRRDALSVEWDSKACIKQSSAVNVKSTKVTTAAATKGFQPGVSHSLNRKIKAHHQIHRHTEVQTGKTDGQTTRYTHKNIHTKHTRCLDDTATKENECRPPRHKRPLPLQLPFPLPSPRKTPKYMRTQQALGRRIPNPTHALCTHFAPPRNTVIPSPPPPPIRCVPWLVGSSHQPTTR